MTASAATALEIALYGCAGSGNPACASIARATYAVTISTLSVRFMILLNEADYKKNTRKHDASRDLQDGLEAATDVFLNSLQESSSEWRVCIKGAGQHIH